jgi:hypothetical protein
MTGDCERPCGHPCHALYLAWHCTLAEGLSGRFLEGYWRKNIWSKSRCLLYPLCHLSILRDDHEQLVGHMRMSLYTSRGPQRQCSLYPVRSQNGHSIGAPIEIFFNHENLLNATFGVLVRDVPAINPNIGDVGRGQFITTSRQRPRLIPPVQSGVRRSE